MTSKTRGRLKAVILRCLLAVLLPAMLLCACTDGEKEMQNGYYTAEAAEYDAYGWKEYITIYVSGNAIITVDYNAKNASGFIKSWDMEYMRLMNETDGTYPNEYARGYAEALLNKQDPENVDVIAGATTSHTSFQLLAQAAIAQAYTGDGNVVFVDVPEVSQ